MDAQSVDQAENRVGGHVIEGVFVFLLEALAQVIGGYVAGFAVGQVALVFVAEFDEGHVSQAEHDAFSIHEKFAIDGVAMARGDAVPAMREAAAVNVIGNFGFDLEGADELAHRAKIGNYFGVGISTRVYPNIGFIRFLREAIGFDVACRTHRKDYLETVSSLSECV